MKYITHEEAIRRYNQVEASQCVVELTKEFRDAATVIAGNGFNTYYRHPADSNTVVMTIDNIGDGSRVFGVVLPEVMDGINGARIKVVDTLIKFPFCYRAGVRNSSRAAIIIGGQNPNIMGSTQLRIETIIVSYYLYGELVNIRTGKYANREIHHNSCIWDNRHLKFLTKEEHQKEPHNTHKFNYTVRPNQLIPVMQTAKK